MKNENNLNVDKNNLKELRRMKQEIESYITEIENIKSLCNSLKQNIKYESEKIKGLKSELEFRNENLEDIKKQLESLSKPNHDNKHVINKFKEGLIKKKLTDLIYDYIPEVDPTNKEENGGLQDNEYHNLVFDNILVIYTIYDESNGQKLKEYNQPFRISKTSTFEIVKTHACSYWEINNPADYVITDEAEGLIYLMSTHVDDYLRDYSPNTNIIRLMQLNALKFRHRLIPLQEVRMKDCNKLNLKEKKKKKRNFEFATNDLTTHRINAFFADHQALRSYIRRDEFEQREEEIDDDLDKNKIKDYENSFPMIVVLFFMLIFTFIFVYNTRNVELENYKKDSLKEIFDNSNINSYQSLFRYITYNIGFNFKGNQTSDDIIKNVIFPDEKIEDEKDKIYYKFLINDVEEIFKDLGIIGKVPGDYYDKLNITYTVDKLRKYRKSLQFVHTSAIRLIINKVVNTQCSDNKSVKDIISSSKKCVMEVYDENSVDKSDINVVSNKIPYLTAKEANITLNV